MDLHVLQLLAEVVASLVHLVGVFGQEGLGKRLTGHDLVVAGVGFQAADGGYQNSGVGGDARIAALDVEEPLGAHVGAETRLGEQEVTGVDADLVGHDRRVAGGDVAERAAVDQGGSALQGLHQVGLDGFLEDDRHRAGYAEVLGGDRSTRLVVADDDSAHSLAQVG